MEEASNLRGIIDRQGDALLELTFANFIKSGELDSHIRKVMKIYRQRRDLFCHLLQKELGGIFKFEIPKGGMAIWTKLDRKYSWENVSIMARKFKLEIGNWQRYDRIKSGHNYIRIGFASYNEDETYELIRRLKKSINKLKK